MAGRIFQLSVAGQGNSQVIVGPRKIGIKLQGLIKMTDGFIQTVLSDQDHPLVVVCVRKGGIQAQRL